MPLWLHLSDLTGTFTWTRLSAFGGATDSSAAAAGSISTAASRVVALQLQSLRFDVPSIQSLLSGATATRAVSCAAAEVATSASNATLAKWVLVILPLLVSRSRPRRSALQVLRSGAEGMVCQT